MAESRKGAGAHLRPKDFCTVEQAIEIAQRVARRELLMAAGRNPDAPVFEQYINGPVNADAIAYIRIMVEEYSHRQRWTVRLRTWLDLRLPKVKRSRR
jgi:hypothetical protein